MWRNRQSQSFTVLGILHCCLKFFCGRHIKVDLSHQPSRNKYGGFFNLPLMSFRSLAPPSMPCIMGSLIRVLLNWFQPVDIPLGIHNFPLFPSLPINSAAVQGLTNTESETKTSDATSFHAKDKRPKKFRQTYFSLIWIQFGFKAFTDCAV